MTAKTKITIILIAIFIILTAIFLIWKPPLEIPQTSEEKIIINNLDNLAKLEIYHSEKTTLLVKQGDNWLVASQENQPANTSLVNTLVADLQEIKSGQIVSTNSSKLGNFNLTDEGASKIKLYDQQDNLFFELLIGNLGGPAYNQTYVRLANSDNSLLIKVNLIKDINQTDWLAPAPAPSDETLDIEQ